MQPPVEISGLTFEILLSPGQTRKHTNNLLAYYCYDDDASVDQEDLKQLNLTSFWYFKIYKIG